MAEKDSDDAIDTGAEGDTSKTIDTDKAVSSRSSDKMQESLEDMMQLLHNQIKNSDWLQHNTAEKWLTDNPEAADQLRNLIDYKPKHEQKNVGTDTTR